jgi:hypothetical protein
MGFADLVTGIRGGDSDFWLETDHRDSVSRSDV